MAKLQRPGFVYSGSELAQLPPQYRQLMFHEDAD
jgi:hypothetical protein